MTGPLPPPNPSGVWFAPGTCECSDAQVKAMVRKRKAPTQGEEVLCSCGVVWTWARFEGEQ